MNYLCGFIGCGNMGGALVSAVSGATDPGVILVSDFDNVKCQSLAIRHGVCIGDNDKIAAECKYIFLGVKPQMLENTLGQLKDTLAARKDRFILVSMAAGTSTEAVTEMAGGEYPVIRIMPNTPVSVGQGAVLYCTAGELGQDEMDEFLSLMSKAGRLFPIDEKLIDAGSAVSGCGPAFAFMFIEALADGGVQCGLPRDKATLLAAQTLLGASALLIESGKHPGELKDAVCSPGGTTIAGVHALENNTFRGACAEAVIAAYKRTLELGK